MQYLKLSHELLLFLKQCVGSPTPMKPPRHTQYVHSCLQEAAGPALSAEWETDYARYACCCHFASMERPETHHSGGYSSMSGPCSCRLACRTGIAGPCSPASGLCWICWGQRVLPARQEECRYSNDPCLSYPVPLCIRHHGKRKSSMGWPVWPTAPPCSTHESAPWGTLYQGEGQQASRQALASSRFQDDVLVFAAAAA